MSLMSPRLEVLLPLSAPQDTGLGFEGHFCWKLVNPTLKEEAVLIDTISRHTGLEHYEIIEELYLGGTFGIGNPEMETIVQCDGVLPAPLLDYSYCEETSRV